MNAPITRLAPVILAVVAVFTGRVPAGEPASGATARLVPDER